VPDVPELPAPIEASASVKLPLEPWRQPVTVTVWLDCEPLVPAVLWSELPVVDPLCAATLTAKAQARATPEAVVTTRLMCSVLLMDVT
jgi:hypothetical protein